MHGRQSKGIQVKTVAFLEQCNVSRKHRPAVTVTQNIAHAIATLYLYYKLPIKQLTFKPKNFSSHYFFPADLNSSQRAVIASSSQNFSVNTRHHFSRMTVWDLKKLPFKIDHFKTVLI